MPKCFKTVLQLARASELLCANSPRSDPKLLTSVPMFYHDSEPPLELSRPTEYSYFRGLEKPTLTPKVKVTCAEPAHIAPRLVQKTTLTPKVWNIPRRRRGSPHFPKGRSRKAIPHGSWDRFTGPKRSKPSNPQKHPHRTATQFHSRHAHS